MAGGPGVRAVQPYLTLPAYLEFTTGEDPALMPPSANPATWRLRVARRRLRVDIRARDPALDATLGQSPEVVAGRGLQPSDEGSPVALVNASVGSIMHGREWVLWDEDRPMYLPQMPPRPGEKLQVTLPNWRTGLADYADGSTVSLDVVGLFRLDGGTWLWGANHLSPAGLEPASYHAPDRPPPNEPRALTTPQIFVPRATWQMLAQASGYGGGPSAWIIRVDDTSRLNVTLAKLQMKYPGRLFLSASALADRHFFAMAPTFRTPNADLSTILAEGAEPDIPSASPPSWVGQWVSGIAMVMGVALFFANVFALYYTRQKELATLRVVGATQVQVAGLVMLEVFLVAIVGVLLATAVSLPMLLFQVGTGGGGLGRTLSAVGAEAGLAVLVAVAFTVTLGGGLALWTARRAPWGVLKIE